VVQADEDDDGLCPHGWPYEFCGICHEEEDERAFDEEQA